MSTLNNQIKMLTSFTIRLKEIKMKKQRIILSFMLFTVLLFACTSETDIITSPETAIQTMEKPVWVEAAEAQGLEIVQLPTNTNITQYKISSTSKFVSRDKEALLETNFNYDTFDKKDVNVNVSLNVPAGALSKDKELSMNINDMIATKYAVLQFGPHGSNFNTPVLLNFEAKGLDLSSLESNSIPKLMYYNPDSNMWEEMNSEEIQIDIEKGTFKCINGELPHFSRFGFIK